MQHTLRSGLFPTSILVSILFSFSAAILLADPSERSAGDRARELSMLQVQACAAAGGALGAPVQGCAGALERREIAEGLAWYRFDLRVGDGPHDRIRLHRVVAELAPYVPKPSRRAVMTVHGDRFTWQATYLSSVTVPEVNDEQALAAFLARRGVDVWGLDFRWVLVPETVEDTSFMDSWGLQLHLDDLRAALAVARLTRLVTGSGFGRLHLVGWSRGAYVGYAYLNEETQRPRLARHVRGFIPLDAWIKTDDEALRQAACDELGDLQASFDAGRTVASGALLTEIGNLALTAPEQPSPFFPPFTNRELALDVGTYPRATPTPGWHPVGGVYDEDFFRPLFLLYAGETHWLTHLATGAAFQPLRLVLDAETLVCDRSDSPFDDHLGEVEVPVLYVGAEGAFGGFGRNSTTLLGSADVSSLVVSLQPPELQVQDFGHADLLLADDAQTLVWEPILSWIEAR